MNVNKTLTAIRVGFFLLTLFFIWGCHPRSYLLEPNLSYTPIRKQIERLPSEFKEFSKEEIDSEWGKETLIGNVFAKELDFYRAITCYKRALVILPPDLKERRMQIEFHILECYFLAGKYQETVETFEFGAIRGATSAFPAFRDLLVMLYESYLKTGYPEKSKVIMMLLEKGDPEGALELKLFTAIDEGDLPFAATISDNTPAKEDVQQFINLYCSCKKSVCKAQAFNAILPGAGYLYVGQKKTALTSLVINTCFIAAAYYFFDHGNWGAGLFTTSLECGWYFGGINGAGLAAKEYNECLYSRFAKDMLIKQGLFPVLMLQTGF